MRSAYRLHAATVNLLVDKLREPNVGNARRIVTQQVNMRVENRRVDGPPCFGQDCNKDNVCVTQQASARRRRVKRWKLEVGTYHGRSRTCGTPVLPPGFPKLLVRTTLGEDHRFSCKSWPSTHVRRDMKLADFGVVLRCTRSTIKD